MQQYANYLGSEHQTQGPSAVHEPQIIRNGSTYDNPKNGGKQGQTQVHSQSMHNSSTSQGQQRSNSFVKSFISQRSGGAMKFVRSHWQSRQSSSTGHHNAKTTRNSRTNVQSYQVNPSSSTIYAMNENQNIQNMQYDSNQLAVAQGNQRESKSQDEKGNKNKRSISGSFIRDSKIAVKIQTNVKAVGGLASTALRSLKPHSSKGPNKATHATSSSNALATAGGPNNHQKVVVHQDLQPNASKGPSAGSSTIASSHLANNRSYSVNRTSSTVNATAANSGPTSMLSRELKSFNKSMVQGQGNGQSNVGGVPSRMSESVVLADNRGIDKNLRGNDHARRAESQNNANTTKVYQTRKPSPSVHSNNQNPSKFYNQVPHKQIKMAQRVNQTVTDSSMLGGQPRFLPRSMTNNAVGASAGGSSGQAGMLPPTTRFAETMQQTNVPALSIPSRSNQGSLDLQNPQCTLSSHAPLVLVPSKNCTLSKQQTSLSQHGPVSSTHKTILSARQAENLSSQIDQLNMHGHHAGSRTQILNLKETKTTTQGSQSFMDCLNMANSAGEKDRNGGLVHHPTQSSQLSMNGSIEKKKGIKGGTAEKLPEITIQQKIQMFHQRCERLIFKQLPRVDRQTLDSVYHVSEFCQSIQQNMMAQESNWSLDYMYMDYQLKIDETTRSKLIDWIIKTHYNFKLLPESLFLTINIIDRYFASRQIAPREVQLVALAAMLIATKYEEIYPPLLKDYVFISDQMYAAEEILEMEKSILFQLDFDIQLTSAYRFLERFSKHQRLDSVTFFLAQYMLELGLLDSKMNQFSNSLQAVAAVYVAKKFLKFYNNGADSDQQFSLEDFDLKNYFTMEDVKNCARCFHQLASLIQQSKFQMINQKFKGSKLLEVARIVQNSLKQKTPYKRSKHNSGCRGAHPSQMQTRSMQMQPDGPGGSGSRHQQSGSQHTGHSQSRTSRTELTTKDTTKYKMTSSEPTNQSQHQTHQSYAMQPANPASVWQPQSSQQRRVSSQTSSARFANAPEADHPAASTTHAGQQQLNAAIMNAKIDRQPVPCNQQQVYDKHGYEGHQVAEKLQQLSSHIQPPQRALGAEP